MRGLSSPNNQQWNEIPLSIDSKNGEKQKKKPWMLEGLVWPVKFSSDPTILAIFRTTTLYKKKKDIRLQSSERKSIKRESRFNLKENKNTRIPVVKSSIKIKNLTNSNEKNPTEIEMKFLQKKEKQRGRGM